MASKSGNKREEKRDAPKSSGRTSSSEANTRQSRRKQIVSALSGGQVQNEPTLPQMYAEHLASRTGGLSKIIVTFSSTSLYSFQFVIQGRTDPLSVEEFMTILEKEDIEKQQKKDFAAAQGVISRIRERLALPGLPKIPDQIALDFMRTVKLNGIAKGLLTWTQSEYQSKFKDNETKMLYLKDNKESIQQFLNANSKFFGPIEFDPKTRAERKGLLAMEASPQFTALAEQFKTGMISSEEFMAQLNAVKQTKAKGVVKKNETQSEVTAAKQGQQHPTNQVKTQSGKKGPPSIPSSVPTQKSASSQNPFDLTPKPVVPPRQPSIVSASKEKEFEKKGGVLSRMKETLLGTGEKAPNVPFDEEVKSQGDMENVNVRDNDDLKTTFST